MGKKAKAKVTITRSSDDRVNIYIKDGASGNRIVSVSMALEDYALAITGLAETPADIEYMPTPEEAEKFGKKRQIQHLSLEGVHKYNGNFLDRDGVLKHIESQYPEYLDDGWELFCDGLSVQQNKTGFHNVSLVKFVDPDPE